MAKKPVAGKSVANISRAGGSASVVRRKIAVATHGASSKAASGRKPGAKTMPNKAPRPVVKRIITVKRFGRRAPSPMKFTDNLLADARRRYETTLEPITWIADDLGVCRTTLRSFASRNGWIRFNAPPLDVGPAARLARQTDVFVAASTAANDGSPLVYADDVGASGAGIPANEMPADGPEMADWLRRELQAQIKIVNVLRARQSAGLLTVEDGLKLGRMLVQLTDTFFKLNHHTTGAPADAGGAEDFPENIDDLRLELARKIDAFVAGRADAGDADSLGAEGLDVAEA